MNKLQKLTN